MWREGFLSPLYPRDVILYFAPKGQKSPERRENHLIGCHDRVLFLNLFIWLSSEPLVVDV